MPYEEQLAHHGLHRRERPVVIAMVSMRMVEMPIDDVIEMIPVRNGFVTAVAAMHMACLVRTASMVGSWRHARRRR